MLPSSVDDATPFVVEHLSPSISIERPVPSTTHLHTPVDPTRDPRSPILLFSWTGTQQNHVAKYTSAYYRIFPDTPIILTGTSINHVVHRTSKQRQRALLPVINIINASAQHPTDILVHAFSERAICWYREARMWTLRYAEKRPMENLYL